MSMRRPVSGDPADIIDALVTDWTSDTTRARVRTIGLIRTAHIVLGPSVVLACLVFFGGSGVTVATIVYLVGLVVGLAILAPDRQIAALALFDILLIGHVSSTDPSVWMALLVPSAAAVSIGWLIGGRATWLLFGVNILAMAGAGAISQPDSWPVILGVFFITGLGLHFNNLQIVGSGHAGVLRVADLIDSLPVIVWESQPESGQLTRTLGWVEDLVGFRPEEWGALPLRRRVFHADLENYESMSVQALASDEPVTHEFRLRCADDSLLGVREVLRRVRVDGEYLLRGVILDIADEAAARVAVDRLAAVVGLQLEPLLVLAARASVENPPTVLQSNAAFSSLAGLDEDDMVGRTLADVAPWLPRVLIADLDDHAVTGRLVDRDDLEIVTPIGMRIFDYTLVRLPDGAVAVQFADVTDRRAATDLIRHQAFHDPLTALPNRTLLFDRLSHALDSLDREQFEVGLLLLDLNQFKEINDTLGHAYGDELLITVGQRLRGLTRDVDTVARLGGDEFAMVVAGATEGELVEIANRIAGAVQLPIEVGGIEVEVSASIGGAVAPLHGNDAHTLLQRADVAMYDAKRSGALFRMYVADDDRHSRDRLTLMGELRNLLSGELEVWYQPKVDLGNGLAKEVEALARWRHPRLGLLAPSHFIELCEVSGLISELTFRVLDEAVAAVAQWPGVGVAVNVPVRNLFSRALPNHVANTLARHGVAADRLILEITEREIMEDHLAIVEVLQDLHQRGVRISIDDFGTGYSSLTHLRRLPVSEIKIDQSFISGMLDSENDYIIARSIIDLAHNLGHSVVAEGVEDTATLQLLRTLGCDAAQGFLFSRPAAASAIQGLINGGPAFSSAGRMIWNTPATTGAIS